MYYQVITRTGRNEIGIYTTRERAEEVVRNIDAVKKNKDALIDICEIIDEDSVTVSPICYGKDNKKWIEKIITREININWPALTGCDGVIKLTSSHLVYGEPNHMEIHIPINSILYYTSSALWESCWVISMYLNGGEEISFVNETREEFNNIFNNLQ